MFHTEKEQRANIINTVYMEEYEALHHCIFVYAFWRIHEEQRANVLTDVYIQKYKYIQCCICMYLFT